MDRSQPYYFAASLTLTLTSYTVPASVLTAHKSAAEATQVHDHYLKGTIHCGQCGSRLIVSNAKNRHGNVYCYFVCSGRHSKRTNCSQSSVLIYEIERKAVFQRAWLNVGRVEQLPRMIPMLARSRLVMRQNLVGAVIYNAAAMPLAAAGVVHPSLAALAMALSSLTVLLNSLRVGR